MKHIATLTYRFDPQRKRLEACANGKVILGYIGERAVTKFVQLLDTDVKMEITNMKDTAPHSRKVRILRAIWIKMGIDQYRADILSAYGVVSTRDLSELQLDELIAKYSAEYNRPANDEIRALRSDVLSLLQKIGVYATNNDWSAVNQYLLSNRIAGKLLFQLTVAELTELRKKLWSITDKNAKAKAKIARLQILN